MQSDWPQGTALHVSVYRLLHVDVLGACDLPCYCSMSVLYRLPNLPVVEVVHHLPAGLPMSFNLKSLLSVICTIMRSQDALRAFWAKASLVAFCLPVRMSPTLGPYVTETLFLRERVMGLGLTFSQFDAEL